MSKEAIRGVKYLREMAITASHGHPPHPLTMSVAAEKNIASDNS